jgi:hypothetical protein
MEILAGSSDLRARFSGFLLLVLRGDRSEIGATAGVTHGPLKVVDGVAVFAFLGVGDKLPGDDSE